MSCRLLAVLFGALGLILSGCAPLAPTAGGDTGHVATQEKKPRSALESFFDDLGRSISQTTRRITGQRTTHRRPASSAAAGGFVLKIERSALVPIEVGKGEQVTVIVRYSLGGAPAKGVAVREKSTLSGGGKELSVLKDESNEKENGTWENTLSFAVPQSATPGKYAVNMQVSAHGVTRSIRHSFTVR